MKRVTIARCTAARRALRRLIREEMALDGVVTPAVKTDRFATLRTRAPRSGTQLAARANAVATLEVRWDAHAP